MNNKLMALIIESSTRFASMLIQSRHGSSSIPMPEPPDPRSRIVVIPETLSELPTIEKQAPEIMPAPEEEKATSIASGCIPCSLGHMGTCTGLLNEAVRFGRSDGLNSPEVIDRVNMCLDELNALEREDLRPEMLAGLPEHERELADRTLQQSRQTRHRLEGLSNLRDLEETAAVTQSVRNEVGRKWFTQRLSMMNESEKQQLETALNEKIEQENEVGEEDS